jgi:hypothetical protein
MSAVRVVCPDGVSPGDEIEIPTPGGTVLVSLPKGVRAGEEFEVSSPKAWLGSEQDEESSSSALLGAVELHNLVGSFEAQYSPKPTSTARQRGARGTGAGGAPRGGGRRERVSSTP